MNPSSEFGPDIWLVDRSLWSNSPISAPPGGMARFADIGPVRYLVALTRLPNSPVKHMG